MASANVQSNAWGAALCLAAREWKRFLRQPHRIIGAVGQPIIFWLLLGMGFSQSFALNPGGPSVSYGEFFLPGVLSMILLFTAIFSTISIIEDRNEGFLQGVLIAPNPPWSMVLGKVLGGVALAMFQASILAILGLLWRRCWPGWQGVAQMVGISLLMASWLTSLGFVMAWKMDSTQGFHALMSVFLFPMWLLSGGPFPADSAWLRWLMNINPLTYGVAGLRYAIYGGLPANLRAAALPASMPSQASCWLVTVLVTIGVFSIAVWASSSRSTGDLK